MNDDKIKEINSSIRKSLETKNFFAALTSILILIDICSKIYNPNLDTNWKRYKKWVEEILLENVDRKNFMNSDNVYYLRCAILHEGATNPNTQKNYLKYAK